VTSLTRKKVMPEMPIKPMHLNVTGYVNGGAIKNPDRRTVAIVTQTQIMMPVAEDAASRRASASSVKSQRQGKK